MSAVSSSNPGASAAVQDAGSPTKAVGQSSVPGNPPRAKTLAFRRRSKYKRSTLLPPSALRGVREGQWGSSQFRGFMQLYPFAVGKVEAALDAVATACPPYLGARRPGAGICPQESPA